MINFNGNILESVSFSTENRAFNYADALFETCKVVSGKILFWEDHYFRLMASMRMLRMEIPMTFTLEFLEQEILRTTQELEGEIFRVKLLVFRNDGGFFVPKSNQISYIIKVTPLTESIFIPKPNYIVDIFKDYYATTDLLATLKTTNKLLNVLASIYAEENKLDTCLLINTSKNISEAITANFFMIKDGIISTPSLSSGCLKGIMRKRIIEIIKNETTYQLVEKDISPFELLKADEVFITNSIIGIQPISNYRKKEYSSTVALELLTHINKLV